MLDQRKLANLLHFLWELSNPENLERLIIAYSRLPESLKAKCTLKIAGNTGWGRVNPGNLVKGENSEKWVEVIHSPSDQQLSQLYADCSFLVMPSIYEGFGLPIIEAMQYGKPCLTSKVSSMPEIAGNAGILVNPFSVSDISALEQLIVDDLKRKIWQRTPSVLLAISLGRSQRDHLKRYF